jgi:hypothetical protein
MLLASADTPLIRAESAHPALDQAVLDALNEMRDGLREEGRVEASTIVVSAAASIGLSVGYVIWLLRGGVLLSSVLSSLPAWRFVDPLPILGRLDDEDDTDESADDSLESLVAWNNLATDPRAGNLQTPNAPAGGAT